MSAPRKIYILYLFLLLREKKGSVLPLSSGVVVGGGQRYVREEGSSTLTATILFYQSSGKGIEDVPAAAPDTAESAEKGPSKDELPPPSIPLPQSSSEVKTEEEKERPTEEEVVPKEETPPDQDEIEAKLQQMEGGEAGTATPAEDLGEKTKVETKEEKKELKGEEEDVVGKDSSADAEEESKVREEDGKAADTAVMGEGSDSHGQGASLTAEETATPSSSSLDPPSAVAATSTLVQVWNSP